MSHMKHDGWDSASTWNFILLSLSFSVHCFSELYINAKVLYLSRGCLCQAHFSTCQFIVGKQKLTSARNVGCTQTRDVVNKIAVASKPLGIWQTMIDLKSILNMQCYIVPQNYCLLLVFLIMWWSFCSSSHEQHCRSNILVFTNTWVKQFGCFCAKCS